LPLAFFPTSFFFTHQHKLTTTTDKSSSPSFPPFRFHHSHTQLN
jgi:hypothetical protein